MITIRGIMNFRILCIGILVLLLVVIPVRVSSSTISINDSYDARLRNYTESDWYTMRDSSVATAIDETTFFDILHAASWDTDKWYAIGHSGVTVDTSVIPDGATINSAEMWFKVQDYGNAVGVFNITLVDFTPVSKSGYIVSDYSATTWTRQSDEFTSDGYTYEDWFKLTLNTAGKNAVNTTGLTSYIFTDNWTADNTSPVWAEGEGTSHVYVYGERSDYPPYIVIDYTALPSTVSIYPLPYINETRILPTSDTNLPSTGLNISINATRGEYEASSFVLKPSGAVTDLQVLATNLTFGEYILPSTATDIKTVKAWYQAANNSVWYGAEENSYLVPELLLKNDSVVRVDYTNETNEVWVTNNTFSGYVHIDNTSAGQFLDNYKIFDNATITEDIQPFALPVNENKQIWLTTHIPDDAVAGTYTGKLWVNSSTSTPVALNFTVNVLPFNLVDPSLEYGIYYPTHVSTSTPTLNDNARSSTLYALELQNMKNHGIKYPTLSQGYEVGGNLATALSLRNQSGMPIDKLYAMIFDDFLNATPEMNVSIVSGGSGMNDWNAAIVPYGFGTVYSYGLDEAEEALPWQRPAWQTIRDNGWKIFASVSDNYNAVNVVGDLLDVAIFAYDLNTTEAAAWHSQGKEIFSYANPEAGLENYGIYRQNYGFPLWISGYNGEMIFAYQWESNEYAGTSIWNDFDNPAPAFRDHVFAYPTSNGVIDTIGWEGMREGIDDTRYADTLTAFEGNNTQALSIITTGISAGVDMSVIRGNLIDAILASDMVADNPPVASFTKNVSSGYVPLAVAFTDTSTNTPTSWYWEFGDGNTSTEQNPVHLYESGGIKYIKFRAANDAGSDWLNGTPIYISQNPSVYAPVAHFYMNISVEGPAGVPPVADFVADTTTAYIGELIYFTDLSTNNPTQWEWLMGTGPTSWYHLYDKNVSYSWYTVGYYNIALTSHNAYGQDTERKDNYIHIIEPPVGYNNSISGQPLFPNDYVWNVPVNNLPLKSNSNAIIAEWVSGTMLDMQFTQPINVVDDSTPHINIFVKADGYRQYSDMYNTTHSVPVPLPMYPKVEACASWPPGSNYCDAHVLIVDTDDHMMYELGYFDNYTYSYPAADRVGAYDLTGYDLKGSYLEPYWGGTASGLETTTGILRYDEIESGEIRHALEFASLYWEESSPYYQWPARAPMGTSTSPNAPMGGERLRLKASFNTNGFSNTNKIILKGLQEFGMIYRDNLASDFDYPFITFITDDDPRWDASDIYELRAGVKNTDFEVVDVSSLMRDPDSGQVA